METRVEIRGMRERSKLIEERGKMRYSYRMEKNNNENGKSGECIIECFLDTLVVNARRFTFS